MEKRSRNERIRIWVTPEEKEMLNAKMEEAGYSNFSAYARKMLLDGHVNKVDFSELRQLATELGNLNRNMHQIVYRAALVKDLHEEDYQDMLRMWLETRKSIDRHLRFIMRTDGEAYALPEAEEELNGGYEDPCD